MKRYTGDILSFLMRLPELCKGDFNVRKVRFYKLISTMLALQDQSFSYTVCKGKTISSDASEFGLYRYLFL